MYLQYLLHSRRETNLLAGGTLAGGLVLVDTRTGGGYLFYTACRNICEYSEISYNISRSPGCPVLSSEVPDSTGDPVTEVAWLVTKSGSEVLASAGCGRVAR